MSTTDVAVDDLHARRVAALQESGWGARFRLVQPRNLAFWVYLLLVLFGALNQSATYYSQSAVYGPALAAALLLFGVYGALFWLFIVHIDRYASLPGRLLVAAFAWGGFAAAGAMASFANSPLVNIFGKWFGTGWALDWGNAVSAPLTEELAKGAGILLLLALGRHVIRTAFDGLVVGAFCGLGFQILEDVQYALTSASVQFGADQVPNALHTIWLRMETGVVSHVLFSAVFGAGLIWFLGTPAEPRRRGRGLLTMLAALVLHGLWNATNGILGTLGINSTATSIGYRVLVGIVGIAVVVAVYRRVVPRERDVVRAVLAPEVASGVLTQDELNALAGDGAARRQYVTSGAGDRRRRGHRLAAAHDLADEIARARGEDTPRVLDARAELARFASTGPSTTA